MKRYVKLALISLLMLSMSTYAEPAKWQVIPAESSLTFTATQNNSPVTGQFKKIDGDILFDKNDLNASKVRITIDMASVSSSDSDLTSTLVTADWFDVKDFPQAIFTADHFTKLSGNQYQADGKLTIQNITLPVVVTFTLDELSANTDKVTGKASIKRTDFKVGKGDWTSTDAVKDQVDINFSITAKLSSRA